MAYDYAEMRPKLFTEDGTELLTALRDNARRLLAQAGAVRAQEIWKHAPSGDSWTLLAGLDYLVEKGDLREITGPDAFGQHRVFVAGPRLERT
jgi:hypothetical protein